jgi:hypothetical protein
MNIRRIEFSARPSPKADAARRPVLELRLEERRLAAQGNAWIALENYAKRKWKSSSENDVCLLRVLQKVAKTLANHASGISSILARLRLFGHGTVGIQGPMLSLIPRLHVRSFAGSIGIFPNSSSAH